jgi:hypothetical protein
MSQTGMPDYFDDAVLLQYTACNVASDSNMASLQPASENVTAIFQ